MSDSPKNPSVVVQSVTPAPVLLKAHIAPGGCGLCWTVDDEIGEIDAVADEEAAPARPLTPLDFFVAALVVSLLITPFDTILPLRWVVVMDVVLFAAVGWQWRLNAARDAARAKERP